MYIERKSGQLTGEARIGRVTFSKTGRTLRYRDLALARCGNGYKWNHLEVASGEEFWVSGPHRDGGDRLYGERLPVEIDEDVRVEYWTEIRQLPGSVHRTRK